MGVFHPASPHSTNGGRGDFTLADPPPRLGQEPELMGAPASAHDGNEATRASGNGDGGIVQTVKNVLP